MDKILSFTDFQLSVKEKVKLSSLVLRGVVKAELFASISNDEMLILAIKDLLKEETSGKL
jgi:hypothetical protein